MKRYLTLIILSFLGLILHAQPKASFTSNYKGGCNCPPLSVNFTNTSTNANSYFWEFDNGSTSTLKNPSAAFINPDKYTVKLTATNTSTGQKDVLVSTNYICISNPPIISIKSDKNSICTGKSIQFTSSIKTDVGVESYIWDFGDGKTSKEQNPKHTFKNIGTYYVKFQVFDKNGCSEIVTISDPIKVTDIPNVSLKSSPTHICEIGQPFTFNPVFNPVGGETYNYVWNFPDGTTSNTKNPIKVFNNLGVNVINLTLRSGSGCERSFSFNHTVEVKKPKANFYISNNIQKGCAPFSVKFINSSVLNTQNGNKFLFISGDGITSSNLVFNHQYRQPRTYYPMLVVTDVNGCVDTFKHPTPIEVYPEIDFEFKVEPTGACSQPTKITAQITKGCKNCTYTWNSGIETKYDIEKGEFIYNRIGTQYLTVIAKNDLGCITSKVIPILIETPKLNVNTQKFSGCVPRVINEKVYITTNRNIKQINWDMGNGTKLSGESINYTYEKEGLYNASVEVIDELGCVSKLNFQAEVEKIAEPEVTLNGKKLNNSEPIFICKKDFNNSVIKITNHKEGQKYIWNIQGKFDPIKNEFKPHLKGNDQNIALKLITISNFCNQTTSFENSIKITPPLADFKLAFLNCEQTNISIVDSSLSDKVSYYIDGKFITSNKNFTYKLKANTSYKIQQIAFSDRNNCTDTFTILHKTLEELNPQITTDISEGCYGAKPQFRAKFSSLVWSVRWEISNGEVLNGFHVFPKFNNFGEYDVKVKFTNINKCETEIILPKFFTLKGSKAAIEIDENQKCYYEKIKLTDNSISSNKIISRKVYIDDNFLRELEPNETFWIDSNTDYISKNKVSKLRYEVLDEQGCKNEVFHNITLTQPTIKINIDSTKYCSSIIYLISYTPKQVENSGFSPYKLNWFINDTLLSTNLSFKYRPLFGNRKVKLKLEIYDRYGCFQSKELDIDVPKVFPLVANYDYEPKDQKCPPVLVRYFDKSVPGKHSIVERLWIFGDGTKSTELNPEKLYTVGNNFNTRLVITDSIGCKDTFLIDKGFVKSNIEGSFKVEINESCMPLKIKVSPVLLGNVSKAEFFMGDGSVINSFEPFEYTYKRVGNFKPIMIIHSDNGCKKSYTYENEIYVRLPNKPQIIMDASCSKQKINISIKSESTFTYKYAFTLLNTNQTYLGDSFQIEFDSPGKYKYKLTVEFAPNCFETYDGEFNIYNYEVKPLSSSLINCVDSLFNFSFSNENQINLSKVIWDFGDGNYSEKTNPSHRYKSKGDYTIRLTTIDSKNCTRTIELDKKITVIDNLPQNPIYIEQISVEQNYVKIKYAPFIEKGIKYAIIHRKTNNTGSKILDTIYDFNSGLYIDYRTDASSNIYQYQIQTMSICELLSVINDSLWHKTMLLNHSIDTNKVFLNWNAYIGFKPEHYLIERRILGNSGYSLVSKFENSDSFLNYIDNNIKCYQDYEYRITAIFGSKYSLSNVIKVYPIYSPKVAIPALLNISVEENNFVSINIKKQPKEDNIKQYIIEKQDSTGQFFNIGTLDSGKNYEFIDTESNAELRPQIYRIKAIDSCNDISLPSKPFTTIHLSADTFDNAIPYLNWTRFNGWLTKDYSIELWDNTWIEISKDNSGNHHFVHYESENMSLPFFKYRVKANSTNNQESYSNTAKIIGNTTFYIPNAFSPNDDNLNEFFGINGKFISFIEITIYNKWGQKVFYSNEIKNKWDGKFKNKPVIEGTYLYYAKIRTSDSKTIYRKGNLYLFR
jgi:gliding motility-associated-like protein